MLRFCCSSTEIGSGRTVVTGLGSEDSSGSCLAGAGVGSLVLTAAGVGSLVAAGVALPFPVTADFPLVG